MPSRCFGTGAVEYLRRRAALLQNSFAPGENGTATEPGVTGRKVFTRRPRRPANGRSVFLFGTVQIDVVLQRGQEDLLFQAGILHFINDDFLKTFAKTVVSDDS